MVEMTKESSKRSIKSRKVHSCRTYAWLTSRSNIREDILGQNSGPTQQTAYLFIRTFIGTSSVVSYDLDDCCLMNSMKVAEISSSAFTCYIRLMICSSHWKMKQYLSNFGIRVYYFRLCFINHIREGAVQFIGYEIPSFIERLRCKIGKIWIREIIRLFYLKDYKIIRTTSWISPR